MTLKYGLIGAGMMGQEHIRNIALLHDVEVAAICEPNTDMANAARQLAPNAQIVPDLPSFFGIEGLDALVIASPNHMHIGQLEEIAINCPLPVLAEKPICTAPEDLERVQALPAKLPHAVWVAMEYRYMPPVAELIKAAEKVTGGVQMLSIREHRFPFLPKIGDWNRFNDKTGGTMVEKCCHFFDLMRHILKDDPVRVIASAGQHVNHVDEEYDGRKPDILDHGYVIVDFKRGARAMLELCMFAEGAKYQEEISVVGPDGKIEALVPGPTRFWNTDAGAPPVPLIVESPRNPTGVLTREVPVDAALLAAGDHNGSTFYQHRLFADLVRKGQGVPEVTLTDGAWAVAMGLAAQIAAQEGRVVEMSEFMGSFSAN
ncbi:MAG: Gfo/Idh/MocA family oxidoreductase [Dinoroseobacter sp.]|nr:Gfo/Idh/MocA family oxidoreductase [Dinoroseobacter sp.]